MVVMLCNYGHFDIALEYASHAKSTLGTEDKLNIKNAIQKYTVIPAWKILLFNNSFIEKLGYVLSLVANSMRIKARLYGWGSDHGAVDSRYKYHLSHPVLRFFRK